MLVVCEFNEFSSTIIFVAFVCVRVSVLKHANKNNVWLLRQFLIGSARTKWCAACFFLLVAYSHFAVNSTTNQNKVKKKKKIQFGTPYGTNRLFNWSTHIYCSFDVQGHTTHHYRIPVDIYMSMTYCHHWIDEINSWSLDLLRSAYVLAPLAIYIVICALCSMTFACVNVIIVQMVKLT